MGTRDELLMAVAARYSAAKRSEKSRILTEFAEISGYHRKHAERLPLRANKRETIDWLKFTLEGAGERTHGYAFTDCAFTGCWI
jgi:hypothetical protein